MHNKICNLDNYQARRDNRKPKRVKLERLHSTWADVKCETTHLRNKNGNLKSIRIQADSLNAGYLSLKTTWTHLANIASPGSYDIVAHLTSKIIIVRDLKQKYQSLTVWNCTYRKKTFNRDHSLMLNYPLNRYSSMAHHMVNESCCKCRKLAYQAVQSNQFMFINDHRFIRNKHHVSNLYTTAGSVVHRVK